MSKPLFLRSILYGILGFVFTIGGIIGLIYPKLNIAENQHTIPELIHTTMELGAAITPIGMLLIWSAFSSNKTVTLEYFYLIFFLLFSTVHWYEFLLGNRQIFSPVINSIPLLMIIVIFILPRNSTSK